MHILWTYLRPHGRLALAQRGKHGGLLEQKGLYYAMWRQQIGEHPGAHAAAFS